MAGMTTRLMLLRASKPTLVSLFDAYVRLKDKESDEVEEIMRGSPELERTGFREILMHSFSDQIYALAGCIVLVADNFAKAYLTSSSLSESDRDNYGQVVAGVKFGKAMHYGANAYRHYARWNGSKPHTQTEAALVALGICARDSSVCHKILELAGMNSEALLESQLDIICDEVDHRSP